MIVPSEGLGRRKESGRFALSPETEFDRINAKCVE